MRERLRMSGQHWLMLLAAVVGAGAGGASYYMFNKTPATNAGAGSTAANFPKPVATLNFEADDGRLMTLEDFRGKAVLLNIWATWCPPCRKEMPSLDRLQARLGGKDFEVVPLSIDRTGIDVVKPFFEEIGTKKLGIYLDRSASVMSSLKVVGLPTTVLIDPDGRELARWIGPKEWDSPAVIEEIQGHLAKTGKAS